MQKDSVTRMLRSKKAKSPEGSTVLVRVFQNGKTYTVAQGRTTVLVTPSEAAAREAFERACESVPSGTPPTRGLRTKRKAKGPIIYRGGLPSLGKRHS